MSCVLTLQQSGYQQNGTGSGMVTISSVSVEMHQSRSAERDQ